MAKKDTDHRDLADLIGRLASGKVDKSTFKGLVSTTRRSLKIGLKGVSISGQGIADVLVTVAPRLPIRDEEALKKAFHGMTGPSLAGHLIRNASRQSAAVGGVTGALASANELAPPLWIMLPAEIVAETLLVAAIEMRLVAELHVVYGRPIEGPSEQRGVAILQAWAERRGVRVEELGEQKALSKALGKGTTNHIVHLVKRKLTARLFRNTSSLAPLFVGAVAGAELNRRATRDLGDDLARNLAGSRAPAPS